MRYFLLVFLLGLAGGVGFVAADQTAPLVAAVSRGELPREARATLHLIEQGGPFPYRRDAVVFVNREQRLPLKPRGAYREYTVPTPGVNGRGARRIIAAQSGEFYYSDDHYRSFRRIRE
ncbi:MAG: ribonuclease [Proteobacteria bacterium]|nr:ribonuclease [Pseudomonadota bacterium]